MADIYEDECKAAGVDVHTVRLLARRIERCARDAQSLGMVIFGGSSTTLRFADEKGGPLILATLEGPFDGGDGGAAIASDGLLRGEN